MKLLGLPMRRVFHHSIPLSLLIVAAGSLCILRGAEACNQYVIVSCEGERIVVEADEEDFTILASGYPASFATNVMVRTRDGGTLKTPNQLPVIMKGGDSVNYKVEKTAEDSYSGTIRFHNYEIRASAPESLVLTEDWKNLEAPYGLSISFHALRNGLACSSDWIVKGACSNDTSQLQLNDSVWYVDGWYLPMQKTPQPGDYSVAAHAVIEPKLQDFGFLKVFGCTFQDTVAHSFGFDDFTNWFCDTADKADDYYGSHSGICTLPYASYIPGNPGHSFLKMLPDENIGRLIDISPLAANIRCFPTNTTYDAVIQFDKVEDCINQVHETDLIASYKSHSLARLHLVPLRDKKRLVAIVNVNGAQSSLTDFNAVNRIFRQCGISYQEADISLNLQYPSATTNHVWTSEELDDVYYKTTQFIQKMEAVDFVILVLPGRDSDESVGAWSSKRHRVIWLFAKNDIPIILAHELGHLESLEDQYYYHPGGGSLQGNDLHNLMNLYDGNWSCGKLRYDQWMKANGSN